ncbi:MAG TPA: thioesterase domain-containing protein, partial [Longimicrobium sp.]|nr:thioesterase domain-containing protein [Longimicrobium sp.]
LPISAYGGERDDDVTEADVEAWREQTTGEFRMRMFPGDHFFINSDRALVLAEMSRELRMLLGRLPHAAAHGR